MEQVEKEAEMTKNVKEKKEMSEKAQEQKEQNKEGNTMNVTEKNLKGDEDMNKENKNVNVDEEVKKGNMKLWNAVEKTNPYFTKAVNYGKMHYTAISAYYQIKVATSIWGPYGSTWGLKDSELNITKIMDTDMVIYKAIFYYPEGSFEIRNSIKVSASDDDFLKKLETDTLTKALSRLGFNADVFLGYFDDSRYIDKLKNELRQEKQQEKSNSQQPVSQKSVEVDPVANSEPENSELESPVSTSNVNSNEYDDLLNVGVIVLRNGDVLVAEGSTFNNKNILKSKGFQWNGDMKKWVKKIA